MVLQVHGQDELLATVAALVLLKRVRNVDVSGVEGKLVVEIESLGPGDAHVAFSNPPGLDRLELKAKIGSGVSPRSILEWLAIITCPSIISSRSLMKKNMNKS